MDAHENDDRGKKRKKKRSNNQMAKKFARRRNHGTDVDSDTYQYMVRVLELIRGTFPTNEEKLLFVNNVYEQTVDHEIEYARNQLGSRVLETLLKYANLEAIQRLVDAFMSSLRLLSNDRFASHVLQKIVLVCADRGNRGANIKTTSGSDETADAEVEIVESEIRSYNDIVLKLSRYFINNIEEFISDTYANHLLRTVIECLGGLIDKPENENKKNLVLSAKRTVIQEYKDLLIQSSKRLLNWPQFLEFGQEELTSGLLQSVLYALKDVDAETMESFINKITNESFASGTHESLSNIFSTDSSIRLLEACLASATPDSFRNIYERFFQGKLKQLSLTQNTNFSVQRLLDNSPTKEDFEKIFDEISPHFSDIRYVSHTGIFASSGNACLRLQTKQGAFVTEITKMLECESPEKQSQIVTCIATLKTQKQLEKLANESGTKLFINLHGSLIVQAILNFNKPIKMVNALLDMNNEELSYLFGDPKGSRIVDAFMDSKFIGEKSREKLTKKLQGCWAQLAQGTHGSRSLENIWLRAQANQRMSIMEELAAAGESLRSSKSGKIISTKYNVPLFARNKKDWLEFQGKEEKTRALFANIIGDAATKKKKKK